jgi:preprotein translocase subunit SecD
MRRRASIITLVALVLGIVALTLLGLYGLQIGRYDVLPFSKSINQGLDLKGGVYAVYSAKDPAEADLAKKVSNAMDIMRKRLDTQGFTEATISSQGTDNSRIRIEIPNVSNPDEVFKLIGTPAKLEITDPNGAVVLAGKRITKAQAVVENGSWVVAFELDDLGKTQFSNATTKWYQQVLTIKLDGNTVSAPRVNSPITGGSGIIEGDFNQGSAEELAVQLESGMLPLVLVQLEARTISATLGVTH